MLHIPARIHIWRPLFTSGKTIDLYRYFDATPQAEFLYEQVADTIEHIIPEEVEYLLRRDEFKKSIDDMYEMPDKTVDLLIRFLVQGNGKLSTRAREKEFAALTDQEVQAVEEHFRQIAEMARAPNPKPSSKPT